MPYSREATPHAYTPADKREGQEGVKSCEQACMRLERRVETVYAYLCTMGTCWMKCVIILAAMYGTLRPGWLGNPLHVKSHIANGIGISWILTCCVLRVMSPISNQIAAVGQNTPTPIYNFDTQLGARTKDWEDTTVATKCSKCGKARNTVPVEGKAMATGLGGIAHTELNPPEKEENVQERLEEVDKEMAGGYVNEENSGDESQGLKNRAKQFIMTVAVTSVVITTLTIYMLVLDDWGAYTGENGYASDFIQIIVRRTQSADMHPISYC